MNLSFLKLRVASCPWILLDTGLEGLSVVDGPDAADWPRIAASLCDASRGAAARGLAVVERGVSRPRLSAWDARGRPVEAPAAALLCAARLLLDRGAGDTEAVELDAGPRTREALVIDAGLLGLELGFPTGGDGGAGGAAPVFRLGVRPDGGIAARLDLGDGPLEVTLFDRPPPRRREEPRGGPRAARRVEALALSRRELRVRPGAVDPLVAAGAALALAVAADVSDRELEIGMGDERLVAQWPSGGPIFAAATPRYCISGEFWFDEAPGDRAAGDRE